MGHRQHDRADYGLRRWDHAGVDGRIGRRVLGRLGIDVDAPPTRSAGRGYETFLPAARQAGYYAVLAQAQGAGQSWQPAQELEWLANQLRIGPTGSGNPRWQGIWDAAIERAQLPTAVSELSLEARLHLLSRLADPAGYPSLVIDALAEALKVDADQRHRSP